MIIITYSFLKNPENYSRVDLRAIIEHLIIYFMYKVGTNNIL